MAMPRHLDVLGALRKFAGIRPDPEALIEVLEPLQPRLYSISSSPKTNPGRVSLTVDTVRYELRSAASGWALPRPGSAGGSRRRGRAAASMCRRRTISRLPQDGATPIIMVGPGTGIAPFRAFLHERHARTRARRSGVAVLRAPARAAHDFFYARRVGDVAGSGYARVNLSLAWSRDAGPKTYVQDKMREAGAELVGLAGPRGALLRLRRCQADGQGRRGGAARRGGGAWRGLSADDAAASASRGLRAEVPVVQADGAYRARCRFGRGACASRPATLCWIPVRLAGRGAQRRSQYSVPAIFGLVQAAVSPVGTMSSGDVEWPGCGVNAGRRA